LNMKDVWGRGTTTLGRLERRRRSRNAVKSPTATVDEVTRRAGLKGLKKILYLQLNERRADAELRRWTG
jgi:hypothetical protein